MPGWPRYFATIRDEDGLLKVENMGIPYGVDGSHCLCAAAPQAVRLQSLRRCRLSARTCAAGARIWRRGRGANARNVRPRLEAAAVKRFWDPSAGCSLTICRGAPRRGRIRTCDRSLATVDPVRPVPRRRDRGRGQVLATARRRWASPIRPMRSGATGRWPRRGHAGGARRTSAPAGRWSVDRKQHAGRGLGCRLRLHLGMEPLPGCAAHPAVSRDPGSASHPPRYATCVLAPQIGDLEQIAFDSPHRARPDTVFRKTDSTGRELTLLVPKEIQAELILDAHDKVSLPEGHDRRPPVAELCSAARDNVTVTMA